MVKLVLVRHGESVWNKKNLFTGWTDVDLSIKGIHEAQEAGRLLKNKEMDFQIAFTSVLKRAVHTLEYILKEMNESVPVVKAYELNERHYGALQGLNKEAMALKYGEEQVQLWRRSFAKRPPMLTEMDERNPQKDPLYKDVPKEKLPLGESLEDTIKRVVPFYEKEIVPHLKNNENVLVVAHGNSLRALVKYLENISDEDIVNLEIPLGMPWIYDIDSEGKICGKEKLGE